MADRSLVVRLKAEVGSYKSDMDAAAKATRGVGESAETAGRKTSTSVGAFSKLSGSIRENRAAWDDISSKAMLGGAAIAGGLGLAAKAAIDWESAWAGVTKTVDGTPEQMAELEQGLRGLAKQLPATHEEIAGVAEAAGQLGVAREDILGFTETAIALGESTNLSADVAAESMAKFSNVMGTAARDGVEGYERMGAALVALGNDGASTEADIMAMALRLSGAGKQIGATEADILALANALSSVGIEAELGGGAMSRAMLKMNSAVIEGGGQLEEFAKISGMSAQDFAATWRKDPIQATNAFVTGLGRIGESGGDAAGALGDVGLKGTQNAQVLLRAAGASDLVTESLELGAKAWEENAALQEEASKRYETTESKLKIAQNTIKDAAIDIGAVFGPALAAGAEKVAGLADEFVKLPGPVQTAATGVAGFTGAALLIGGATVKAIGWAQDIGDALDRVGVSTRNADGDMTRFGRTLQGAAKWGGYAAGILAVATAIGQIAESANEAPPSIEATTSAILDMRDAAKGSELSEFFAGIGDNMWTGNHVGEINNLADAYERLTDPGITTRFVDWKDNLFPGLSSGAEQVESSFARIGEALAAMPAERAAEEFERMVEALGGGQEVRDNLLKWMPAYRDQLAGAANEAKMAGDKTAGMNDDLSETEAAASEAEDAIEDLAKTIKGLGDTILNAEASHDSWIKSVKDVEEAIQKNGYVLKGNSDAAMDNRAALRDLVDETQEWAVATLEATDDYDAVQAVLDKGKEKWIAHRDAARMNKEETRELAAALFDIPEEATTKVETLGVGKAKEGADSVKKAVRDIPAWKQTQIAESGSTESRKRVLYMTEAIKDLNGKTVSVAEVGSDASRQRVEKMDGAIFGLKGKTVNVTEFGSTLAGERVVGFRGKVYALPGSRTTNVNANVNGQGAVDTLKGRIDQLPAYKSVTITTFLNEVRKTFAADGAMFEGGSGFGLRQSFADGGFAAIGSQQPQIRAAGGLGITWAEDGAGPWEAFISGHPGKRARSRAIAEDTVGRLGGEVAWRLADGGLLSDHASRTYVAPRPTYASSAPAGGGVAVVDPAPIEAAVSRAMSGWKPMVNIGGREFYGVMRQAQANRKGRG